MPTLAPMLEITVAEREARANWEKNVAALRVNQSEVVDLLETVELDLEWLYARDGTLTGMQRDGQWWGNCSLPLLAGRAVLKTLEPAAGSACLLAPPHAGLVRATQEKAGPPSLPLFVVQPDFRIARVILTCRDFSEQISSHRLWLACGENWPQQLRALLDEHQGLAMPTRFIRTKWTGDEIIQPLITAAQEVLSAVATDRAALISAWQAKPVYSADIRRILLIGGSEFRLWDEAATTLDQQLRSLEDSSCVTLHRFNTDDARCGSPVALLDAVAACGSVVSANLRREDSNQLIPTEIPWIIWITQPAVPAFNTAGPTDALVLADPAWKPLARNAGWPDDRVRIAGWPMQAQPTPSARVTISTLDGNPRRFPPDSPLHRQVPAAQAASPVRHLAIICDTRTIEIPESVEAFSSHRLLWDLIAEELHADPLAVEQIDGYLSDRAAQLHIQMEVLDTRSFFQKLILPAYQQGLARLLIAAGLPISIWGRGWAEVPEFSANFKSEITNAADLRNAVDEPAALIYCWPERFAHPIETLGKPVVHRSGRDRQQLLRNARFFSSAAVVKIDASRSPPLGKTILQLISAR